MSEQRGRVRSEPSNKRVRGFVAGQCVVDTTDALYVWEGPNYPLYYLPISDFADGVLVASATTARSPSRGTASYFTLRSGAHDVIDAGWSYTDSPLEALRGRVRLEWSALDAWFEEDEEVFVHPTQDSVNDLKATLALVTAENTKTGSLLQGHVDTDHVAAVGHSAGGATVLSAAQQMPEVDGYVSLASGIFRGNGTSSTTGGATTSTTQPPMPEKPSLFVAGKDDGVVSFDEVTKPAFDTAAPPTRLWVIDKVGHNGFDDFCTFGGGKGIIGVAEAAGLGPALSKPPLDQFKKLGEDGCLPPALPVQQTWPIMKHVVTAWLRNLFGTDPQPVGLGADVGNQYNVSVRIESRLG